MVMGARPSASAFFDSRLRSTSTPVMSARSCWNTCGTVFHACVSLCAVVRRTPLIGLRSIGSPFAEIRQRLCRSGPARPRRGRTRQQPPRVCGDVVHRDAAAGARALNLGDVHAELAREPPRRRRRGNGGGIGGRLATGAGCSAGRRGLAWTASSRRLRPCASLLLGAAFAASAARPTAAVPLGESPSPARRLCRFRGWSRRRFFGHRSRRRSRRRRAILVNGENRLPDLHLLARLDLDLLDDARRPMTALRWSPCRFRARERAGLS